MNQQQEKPNNPPQTTNNQFSNHPIASKQISTNHQEKSKKNIKPNHANQPPHHPKKITQQKKTELCSFPTPSPLGTFFYFDTEGGWNFQKVFPKWWWKMVIHYHRIATQSPTKQTKVLKFSSPYCWTTKEKGCLTLNPNDPCFDWKRPCFGGFDHQI